ncbi:KpsF/GutQ family sugar-phosphate isomerase [Vibrio cholerae]|uniref:KpsF/GutQ family sugar-phosphate isomerase n=1 Tax=Vibrio cholerae TaxID=666 RepID=UPI00005F3F1E|nr:KpsF/GutQ family sugar-phosphate isomerase [Vibrio cholerae]EFH72973.1 arabinose-5-phosphate isomerase [Vibrio cholerae RC385]OFI73871.1 arabinose-5-phosphate isomerase [Vibrio cholerae]OFI75043.1 arabinose-5-phosphate isomerase [Vibrio cholerae]
MSVIERAREVLDIEIQGLRSLSQQLDKQFEKAVQVILATHGRTIICGMGKSGIVGKKIAASLASTGTPSFFMHPGEAFHGDLGMVKPEDVFIAISNSGETDEVLKLLPFLKDNGNYLIAMTGNRLSTLAKAAHCHLNIAVPQEACPLQLAPTASTTATIAMGDALTICLMEERKFQPENFARFHPGGSLGRKLMRRVSDEMVAENLPIVSSTATFKTVIEVISSGKLGLSVVQYSNGSLGVITDGDLRRSMEANGKSAFDLLASDIASVKPFTIRSDAMMQEAFELMDKHKVSCLLVVERNQFVGLVKK